MNDSTNGREGGFDPPDTTTTRAAKLFARYPRSKMDRFTKWLTTPHGQAVYTLFSNFARQWWEAGNSKCGASLIGNRIRWEMSINEYRGYKVPNDFLPMMARQLVVDAPEFQGMFNFHGQHEAVEQVAA